MAITITMRIIMTKITIFIINDDDVDDDVDHNDCLPGVPRHQIPAVAIQPGARRFDFFLNNNRMMLDVITICYKICC